MAFKADRFSQATFRHRTKEVPVSELSAWFEEGDEPVFVVRGVTADELARCKEAHTNNLRAIAIADALRGESRAEITQAVREAIGRAPEDKHHDVAFRQQMVLSGLVEPELDEPAIATIAEHYPMVLWRLSEAINGLTGQGSEAGKKQKRFSTTPASEPASA